LECTERVTYEAVIDKSIDYLTPETTGDILFRLPFAPGYVPWIDDSAWNEDISCGIVKLKHCASALKPETKRGATLLDNQEPCIELRISQTDLVTSDGNRLNYQSCLSHGTEAWLRLEYKPKVKPEFPIRIDVALSDTPFEPDTADTGAIPRTPFVERLYLRFHIFGELSNLTQEVEQKILGWIHSQSDEIEKIQRRWQGVLESLRNNHTISSSTQEAIDRTAPPSVEEAEKEVQAYGDLLTRIHLLLDIIEEKEEALLVEDLAVAIEQVKKQQPTPLNEHSRHWISSLEQRVGSQLLNTPIIRYIGVRWPLPEPHLDWSSAREPFQLVESGWSYNPKTNYIERRNLKLKWRSRDRHFEAAIDLPVRRAMHVDAMDLEGRLVIETGRLLSGLNVKWESGATRYRRPVQETYHSLIEVNFEGEMTALFQNRLSHIHRSWFFEGILPTRARYNEIKDLLADASFTVLPKSQPEENVINAISRQQGLPTTIELRLLGQEETGRHSLHFDEDRQQIERNITIGSSKVECEIIGEGDLSSLIDKIDNLFARLRDRWGQAESVVLQGTWYKEA